MDDVIFMDAEIRPHRSLSQKGLIILIAVITALNCACAALFLSMGAVFVPMFLGLDVLAVTVALLASFSAARQIERIRVTGLAVRVTYETPTRSRIVWESPTAFTRVSLRTENDQAIGLSLALSGKEEQVAKALSPPERAQFARALEGAIWKAKRGLT